MLNEKTMSLAEKRKQKRDALQNKLAKNSQDFLRTDVRNNIKNKMAEIFTTKKKETVARVARERLDHWIYDMMTTYEERKLQKQEEENKPKMSKFNKCTFSSQKSLHADN